MVKFLKYSNILITILLVVVVSLGKAVAVDNPGIIKSAEGKETVEVKPDSELKENKKENVIKADSTKSVVNTTAQTKKATKSNTEVKKSNNSSPSIFSYNFVFYLMYKFKIADILNISKENNKILVIPGESSIVVKGKSLLVRLIYHISD